MMPTLLVVPRDVSGFVSATILARYLRYYLLEEMGLTPRELRFSSGRRVGRFLADLAGSERDLTRAILAGIGPPAEPIMAGESLERLKYQGVEVDWYDSRPWASEEAGRAPARAARAISGYCRLVLPAREIPSLPQFLMDRLRLDDHLSAAIAEIPHGDGDWLLVLCALRHEEHFPQIRATLRRLAFGPRQLGPVEEALRDEERGRRHWMERDLRLLVPFPTQRTATEQRMALVDLRSESAAPPVHPFEVAHRVASWQDVRYTLIALPRRNPGGWEGHLFSWPTSLGDLAAVPGLTEAGEDRFERIFEAPHAACFRPRAAGLMFRELAREIAARL